MPSDKYTPLKPIKCVSVKHNGIKIITFLVTASINEDFVCPSATFIFCKVICTKNIIEPIRKNGVYCLQINLTLSLAENIYVYISGTAREIDHTTTAKINAIIVTYLIPFFSLSASIQAPTKSSDSGSVKKGDSLIVYGAYGDDGVLYADRIYVYQFES